MNNNSKGDVSASKLKIIAFNANSIGKQPKRRQVLCFLRKKDPDLLVIVDTRFSKDIENSVKAEWGGQVLFSSFSSQARGVAIFVKKNLPLKFSINLMIKMEIFWAFLLNMKVKGFCLRVSMDQMAIPLYFMKMRCLKKLRFGIPITQFLWAIGI